MAGYYIESVQCGIGNGGFACGPVVPVVAAEAKVRTDDGEEFYFSLAEVDGIPEFYKAPKSILSVHLADEPDDDAIDECEGYQVDCGDYDEIFETHDPEWFDLFALLIYIVRTDREECERFQTECRGKYLDEIVIPVSDDEWEYMADNQDCDYDLDVPETKEELFRLRLSLETETAVRNGSTDMDAYMYRLKKTHLRKVVAACDPESEYNAWKKGQ